MLDFDVIKDGRGRTYTKPLSEPRRADIYDDREATHVVVWFNHSTRDWVVSLGLADGTQIGDSEYCGFREWAEESALALLTVTDSAGRERPQF